MGPRRVGRTVLLVVLMAVASSGLTGCGPAVDGTTGLTVDDQGRLTVVIAMCDQPVDSVVIRDSDAPLEDHVASWYSRELVRGYSEVTVGVEPEYPWVVDQAWDGAVADDVDYVAWGVMADGSWMADQIEFTASDLERLRRDRILVTRYDERATAIWVSLTREQMRAEACRH